MKFESIKHIYIKVIKENFKIEWNGEEKYSLTRFHDNGQRLYLIDFNDGEKDGRSFWWYEDGTKMEASYYANGKLHGGCRSWNCSGDTIFRSTYRHGKLDNRGL